MHTRINLKKIISIYELPEVTPSDSHASPLKLILQTVKYTASNSYGVQLFRKDVFQLQPSYLAEENIAKLTYSDEELTVKDHENVSWEELRFDSEETALEHALNELFERKLISID